jgi:catechol 2,3-dioxygenase-like lactoylglutathione lyase family enzyme
MTVDRGLTHIALPVIDVDVLYARAQQEGVLIQPQQDAGYLIGYWAFLRDPDGHTLELSYGQEIGLTVEQNG